MSPENSKIFNDEHEYLTLFELSKSQRYSLEYLLQAAVSGRLKAFKLGDDWLTTAKWFEDYNFLIKKEISWEISRSQIEVSRNKWVEFFTGQSFKLALAREMFLIILIFSVFSLSLSWLAFSDSGRQLALMAKPATDQKYELADQFLNYTGSFYSYGWNYFSYLTGQAKSVAVLFYDSSKQAVDETVYLVRAADQGLEKYQVADELLTAKIYDLAQTVKNQYQAVAGETEIRQQIYFDDWQDSLKDDD